MTSTYLKESLAKIGQLKQQAAEIESKESRDAIMAQYPALSSPYVITSGRLAGAIKSAIEWELPIAQRNAERMEVIECEYERLISILENIGVNLDEEDLVALELVAKRDYAPQANMQSGVRETSPYRDQREAIARTVNRAISEVQEGERELEHDNATDALLKAGFVFDEERDFFVRDNDCVTVTLVNGRECRYTWEFAADLGATTETGKSGEFSRLLELIQSKTIEVAQ